MSERWATKTQQSRNSRQNTLITFNGVTRCVSEWAELTGQSDTGLRHRLSRGWSVERALTKPPA